MQQPTTIDPILRTQDVCRLLGITRQSLWRWRKAGFLQAIQLGPSTVGFRQSEVVRFLDSRPAA